MDLNDFIGSFAQENVDFTTRVVRINRVGDNYWKLMVFVENNRFVDTSVAGWTPIPGSSTIKGLAVTARDYAEYTTGLLQSWLYDLFANGFTGDCILIACAPKMTDATTQTAFITAMTTAYDLMKAYAYHKTACVIANDYNDSDAEATDLNLNATVLVELGKLCQADSAYLSGVPLLPYATATPENLESDPIYNAFNTAKVDAFLSAHQDTTRNASLYSLGLALSMINASQTCVGNAFDMWKSLNITSSGPDGTNLSLPVRRVLKNAHIQAWKPVGDNSGSVAAEGALTLLGAVYPAYWIKAYITYMTRVGIAQLMTDPNFLRSSLNYGKIITILNGYLGMFITSGRLRDVSVQAPAFDELPESETEIIINDAWQATYVDQVRRVSISGTLYIGSGVGEAGI